MDATAIASVEAIRFTDSSANPVLRDPVEQVQLAQLSQSVSSGGQATGAGSAYADLSVNPTEGASAQADWLRLTRTVVDGTNQGILKPRILELEKTLAAAEKTPGSVSTERIAMLMLKVSEASAVTNMLSTSVNAVRRSVATLVEKTG